MLQKIWKIVIFHLSLYNKTWDSPTLINLTNLTKKSPSRPIPGFLSFRSDIFSYLYGTFLTLYSMFNMKKSLSLLRLLTAAILLSASGGCSETNDPDPEGGVIRP